jgi:hypothetical protein
VPGRAGLVADHLSGRHWHSAAGSPWKAIG